MAIPYWSRNELIYLRGIAGQLERIVIRVLGNMRIDWEAPKILSELPPKESRLPTLKDYARFRYLSIPQSFLIGNAKMDFNLLELTNMEVMKDLPRTLETLRITHVTPSLGIWLSKLQDNRADFKSLRQIGLQFVGMDHTYWLKKVQTSVARWDGWFLEVLERRLGYGRSRD